MSGPKIGEAREKGCCGIAPKPTQTEHITHWFGRVSQYMNERLHIASSDPDLEVPVKSSTLESRVQHCSRIISRRRLPTTPRRHITKYLRRESRPSHWRGQALLQGVPTFQHCPVVVCPRLCTSDKLRAQIRSARYYYYYYIIIIILLLLLSSLSLSLLLVEFNYRYMCVYIYIYNAYMCMYIYIYTHIY